MPAISDRLKVATFQTQTFFSGEYEKKSVLSQVSNDGQYVLATGIYKPRLRCYDLHNLGMKFERCLDSEVDFVLTSS